MKTEAEEFPIESDAAVNEVASAPASEEGYDAVTAPKVYLPPRALSTGAELPSLENAAPFAEQEVSVAGDGVAEAAAGGAADNAEATISEEPINDSANADEPTFDLVDSDAPVVPAVATAVAPTAEKSVPSKTKIRTELEGDVVEAGDEEEEEEDDDDEEQEDFAPFHKNDSANGHNGWPVNSFFPVSFGQNRGSAIAVANSFSTGKKGAATSHAIAYGSSANSKTKSF